MDHLSLVQAGPGPCCAHAPGSAVTLCAYQKVMAWSTYKHSAEHTTNKVSTTKIAESNVASLHSLFLQASSDAEQLSTRSCTWVWAYLGVCSFDCTFTAHVYSQGTERCLQDTGTPCKCLAAMGCE